MHKPRETRSPKGEIPDLRSLIWLSGFVLVGSFGLGYLLQGVLFAVVNVAVATAGLAAIVLRVRVLPRRRGAQELGVRDRRSATRRLAGWLALGVIAGSAGVATLLFTDSEIAAPMAIALGALTVTGAIALAVVRRGWRS